MSSQIPALLGIDHIHISVPDKQRAADWYCRTLGFHVVDALRVWDTPNGPLTLADASGSVHLALFAAETYTPLNALALKAEGTAFLAWLQYLGAAGILQRCADHQVTCSLYFTDPFGHQHEITSWDTELIRPELARLKAISA